MTTKNTLILVLIVAVISAGCSSIPKFKEGDCIQRNTILKLGPQIGIYNNEPMYPLEEIKTEFGKKIRCP